MVFVKKQIVIILMGLVIVIVLGAVLYLLRFVLFFGSGMDSSVSPHPMAIKNILSSEVSDFPELQEAGKSDSEGLSLYRFSYKSPGGLQYGVAEFSDEKADSLGRLPVIILLHGYVSPPAYNQVEVFHSVSRFFADRGFLVLKPDFRGHGESEGVADDLYRTSEYAQDVYSLLQNLDAIEVADSERVFLLGHSMGGEVALRIMESGYPVLGASLWAPMVFDFPKNYLYFKQQSQPLLALAKYFQALKEVGSSRFSEISVSTYVSDINIPVNFHHGELDFTLSINDSKRIAGMMSESNDSVQFYSYPDGGHNLAEVAGAVLDRDLALFNRILEKGSR